MLDEYVMNASEVITQQCQNCGKQLKGRIDKKFCDSGCRNTFNNERIRAERDGVGAVERILRNNRSVLRECLGERPTVILSRVELVGRGFRFRYHTHRWENRWGEEYWFVYDFGYLMLEDGEILVVKRK